MNVREDVALLVRYFVQKFSRRLNKTVEYVPAEAMEALVHYSWPGNVRELENLVERAVLLSPGKELRVPVAELKSANARGRGNFISRVRAVAFRARQPAGRDSRRSRTPHILRALRQTAWRIAGAQGAAERPRHETHHLAGAHAETGNPPPHLERRYRIGLAASWPGGQP